VVVISGEPTEAVPPEAGLRYVTSPAFETHLRESTAKWDREWLRYFQNARNYKDFFYDMSGPNYALAIARSDMAKFSETEMLAARPFFQYPLLLWARGEEIADKTVLEIGCGPGLMGRILGRLAERYWGLDFSPLAISIARLTSPESCRYATLSDAETLNSIAGTIDTAVSRHFFIHQNMESAVWLMSLQRDLLKPGGVLIADFFGDQKNAKGSIRQAAAPTDPARPSAVYWYSDEDVHELAGRVGLDIEHATFVGGDWPRRYVRLRKR
jgi:SAM-dependent methyltransferase